MIIAHKIFPAHANELGEWERRDKSFFPTAVNDSQLKLRKSVQ